ncbi:unnamed protein product [Arctia plantaginis]|uniref:Uncharacterized protein n=1 Tax=Arctia plantaginis TaxID=874455 RepID=A0A8S1A4S0_ARCPL|nr:unnamed protein product [Arctia plantaginis]
MSIKVLHSSMSDIMYYSEEYSILAIVLAVMTRNNGTGLYDTIRTTRYSSKQLVSTCDSRDAELLLQPILYGMSYRHNCGMH